MEEGSCAVRSRWILIKPSMLGICFCYRPHCLLPWQQTEISLHTLHPSAFQHRYHPLVSSLPTPPKLLPTSLLPASSGVWGIHFNWSPADKRGETGHMTNSDVSEITASLLFFSSSINLRASDSGRIAHCATEWIELLFTTVSEQRGAQRWPCCATTLGYHASPSGEAV